MIKYGAQGAVGDAQRTLHLQGRREGRDLKRAKGLHSYKANFSCIGRKGERFHRQKPSCEEELERTKYQGKTISDFC